MTIGTGFAGGSSIGDNLTPHHFVHFARIAYNKDAAEVLRQVRRARSAGAAEARAPPSRTLSVVGGSDEEAMRRELRKIILEELSAVLAA